MLAARRPSRRTGSSAANRSIWPEHTGRCTNTPPSPAFSTALLPLSPHACTVPPDFGWLESSRWRDATEEGKRGRKTREERREREKIACERSARGENRSKSAIKFAIRLRGCCTFRKPYWQNIFFLKSWRHVMLIARDCKYFCTIKIRAKVNWSIVQDVTKIMRNFKINILIWQFV